MSAGRFPELHEGEYVVLRGGFGGPAKWMWTGFMGVVALLLAVVSVGLLVKGTAKQSDIVSMATILPLLTIASLVPWLRSGRFELTNRRISWEPTMGARKDLSLADVLAIKEVNPNTGAIRLRMRGEKKLVSLRHVGGWKKLWSALLLYRTPGMDAALPAVTGQVSHLAYRAPRQQGRTGLQNGTLVFRPDRAWYLPDAAILNMLGEALGGMFKGQVTVQPELPTLEHVERLARGSEAEFDERMEALCKQLEGMRLRPGAANITRKPAKLRKSHDLIRVSSPTGVLQKGVDRQKIDALGWFDRWLQV